MDIDLIPGPLGLERSIAHEASEMLMFVCTYAGPRRTCQADSRTSSHDQRRLR